MKDTTLPMRKAYTAALAGLVASGIPVYYQQVPDDINPAAYAVISFPSNTDNSTKQTNDSNVSGRVSIYTRNEKGNNGQACASIAASVYAAILPSPVAVLVLDNGLQMVNTTLQSDNEETFNIKNTTVYIDRIITFTHKINHK